MEKAPRRNRQQIEAELAETEREIIGLEQGLGRQHSETGSNSIDDNSQEATADQEALGMLAAQLNEKRERMINLQRELEEAA